MRRIIANESLDQYTNLLKNLYSVWDSDEIKETRVKNGYRRSVEEIVAVSSINGRLAVAAGLIYGLSNEFIVSHSMVDFFAFYCGVNYSLYNPTFAVDEMVSMFGEREKWHPYMPYIDAGFTDMGVIKHAIENGIDSSLLSNVDDTQGIINALVF